MDGTENCGLPVQTHDIKCASVYFDAVRDGLKTFEVRRDDRGYQRGDLLVMRKWGEDGVTGRATYLSASGDAAHWTDAETMTRRVLYVLTGGQFGIEPGFVVLALGEK